jgi:flagellar protein FliO/FliZ
MPSTARIAGLIFLLLLQGSLLAQTDSPEPKILSPIGESNQEPLWVTPLPNTAPVSIPPPLPIKDKAVESTSFEEQQPDDRTSPAAGSNSSAPGNKQTIPLHPLNRESHMSLSPPNKSNSQDILKKSNGLPSTATIAGSLAIVLGIFLLFAWMIRRVAPQGLTRLPNEAFEVLGRAPLAGRQNVHMLRCGNKLLLVSITPAGTETLTEITDPQEVDRLAGLCRQSSPHSSTAAFRQIFEQLAPKRPSRDTYSQSEYDDYDPSEIELPGPMDWEHRNV